MRPWPRPPRPRAAWGPHVARGQSTRPVCFSRARRAPQARSRRDPDRASTARCCPTRSARSPAVSRSSSSPAGCRISSRASSPRTCRPTSTAIRFASRSASSPGSRHSTSRRWCRCGCTRCAIACGNAFILKPSRKGSVGGHVLGRAARRGRSAAGRLHRRPRRQGRGRRASSTHPGIQAVSFVGSTPIARYIYETGTRHGKRVQALGGAKNHMVVLPDADLDLAADSAVSAAYGSTGQRCMAISCARRGRRCRRSPAAARCASGCGS